MATAEQLKALFKSHLEKDEARFLAVALQVAAQAARQGHVQLAHELRSMVDEAKQRAALPQATRGPTPLVQPRGELAGLLSVSYPKNRLGDMVLHADVRRRLERILHEHRQHAKLREHGLSARHRVLLIGPPGCGKTLTAAVLAGEMGLPLFTIVLEGLITKFMGETAAKLRLIFEATRQTRGVYLFDEFDAIGGQRTLGNDVGEIRRVLNSFLQLLEQDDSNSLLIAATNHPQMLDPALFRRFDDVIEYALPTGGLVTTALREKLGTFGKGALDWKRIGSAARGLSYGDLTRACEDAAKQAILDERQAVSTEDLIVALKERRLGR